MEEQYRMYLAYLEDLRKQLESLTALAKEKPPAVAADDLAALNDIMKREQVLSLSFRGLEQTRTRLQKELGLEKARLSQLPQYVPESMREQARQIAVSLKVQYMEYQKASTAAREVLEKGIQEVESTVRAMGGTFELDGAGYDESGPQTPQSMRTDFRA